jgi:DNA-binding NtrC family response regulator
MEQAVISMAGDEEDADTMTNFASGPMDLYKRVQSYESSIINAALLANPGNITKAARALGIPRTSLIRKLEKMKRTQGKTAGAVYGHHV